MTSLERRCYLVDLPLPAGMCTISGLGAVISNAGLRRLAVDIPLCNVGQEMSSRPEEPCDSRRSRTVLGAPGGEIPPGDSTKKGSLHETYKNITPDLLKNL